MSGGFFEYKHYLMDELADDIKRVVENNNGQDLDEWGCRVGKNYSPEVIERFNEAIQTLKQASIMVNRIDWLLSGDDGEETFMKRWDEDLNR
jgi:hypothetical protein